MRRGAAAAVVALGACAAALGAGVAWTAPAGKVVRVERGHGRHNPPVLCEINDRGGRCFMGRPYVGDALFVLDPNRGNRVIAIGHITSVTDDEPCADRVWTVAINYDGLDPGVATHSGSLGVANLGLTSDAQIVHDAVSLPSSAAPGESPAVTIDRRGSGHPDLVLTFYQCDSSGSATSSGGGTTFCLAIWADDGRGLARLSSSALEANCLQ